RAEPGLFDRHSRSRRENPSDHLRKRGTCPTAPDSAAPSTPSTRTSLLPCSRSTIREPLASRSSVCRWRRRSHGFPPALHAASSQIEHQNKQSRIAVLTAGFAIAAPHPRPRRSPPRSTTRSAAPDKSPTNGLGSLVSTFPVHTSTESCHRTLRTAARAWEQSLARTRPPDLEAPRYRLRQNHPLISSGSFRFGNCRYRGPEDRSFRNPSGGSVLRS